MKEPIHKMKKKVDDKFNELRASIRKYDKVIMNLSYAEKGGNAGSIIKLEDDRATISFHISKLNDELAVLKKELYGAWKPRSID